MKYHNPISPCLHASAQRSGTLGLLCISLLLFGCVEESLESSQRASEELRETKTETALVTNNGDPAFIARASGGTGGDTPIGIVHAPQEGESDWLFEGIVPAPPEYSGPQFETYRGVASHPQRTDIIYLLSYYIDFAGPEELWKKTIYSYNLTTGDRVELWSSELGLTGIASSRTHGLGTDCDGHIYGHTYNPDTARYEISRLDPLTGIMELVDADNETDWIDLVGDLANNIWVSFENIHRRYGPDPEFIAPTQQETWGLALTPNYVESGGTPSFFYITPQTAAGADQAVRRIVADGSANGENLGQVIREIAGGSPQEVSVGDLATLPGWCPCGGGLPATLDTLNAELDALSLQKFYLEWDLANAGSIILFEDFSDDVLAHEHQYTCSDEQSVPGLQACLSLLITQIEAVQAQIDIVTEAYQEQGCELGDL